MGKMQSQAWACPGISCVAANAKYIGYSRDRLAVFSGYAPQDPYGQADLGPRLQTASIKSTTVMTGGLLQPHRFRFRVPGWTQKNTSPIGY